MLTNKLLVSIIIPTFNRAHLIAETLDSISMQTYGHWECLVVDDGSSDHTAEILQQYSSNDPRFKYYSRPKARSKGANACRNFGFEKSSGVFINWFDSDDIMHPSKLEIQVQQLTGSSKDFAVCQTLVFEDSIANTIGFRAPEIHSKEPLTDFVKRNIVFLTQAPLFKRSFLEKYNLSFDETLQSSQEWEFFCRCLFFAKDYESTEKPLVYFRRHPESISSSDKKEALQWNYYLARKKVYNFLKQHHKEHNLEAFFKSYFKNYFFIILYQNDFRKVLYVYFRSIQRYYKPAKKLALFGYVLFVCLFGKGYRFKKYFI